MINKAICLTLDKRLEMGKSVVEQAKEHGIEVELFIAGDGSYDIRYDHIDTPKLPPKYLQSLTYPSWTNRPNAYNAWQCHHKMMRQALDANVDQLLMLEDDVFFEEDFDEILDKVRDFFKSNVWDMLYFGWYSHNHLQDIGQEHIYRMMGGGGFHAVLLNRDMLETLVEVAPLGPYDYISGVFLHQQVNAYAIYPSIISQRSGYSYVEGGILDKPDRYHK